MRIAGGGVLGEMVPLDVTLQLARIGLLSGGAHRSRS